jgi:hypothetical protein
MSSITGFQKSINEIEIIEEIEKLLEKEKRLKLSALQTNQLQNSYYTYLSTLFSQKQQYEERTEYNASTLLSPNSTSSAYLLCEPKQLDFNSEEKNIILSFMSDQCFEEYENKNQEFVEKNVEKVDCVDRALSPIHFPETKSVQTDNQEISHKNNDLNDLINDLKLLLKTSIELNYAPNNSNELKCLSQCTQTCYTNENKSTQYEFCIETKSSKTQTELLLCDKRCQTLSEEEKSKLINKSTRFTQTDQLTDEEKSSNSYEFSIGEVPYFGDYSDSSSYC